MFVHSQLTDHTLDSSVPRDLWPVTPPPAYITLSCSFLSKSTQTTLSSKKPSDEPWLWGRGGWERWHDGGGACWPTWAAIGWLFHREVGAELCKKRNKFRKFFISRNSRSQVHTLVPLVLLLALLVLLFCTSGLSDESHLTSFFLPFLLVFSSLCRLLLCFSSCIIFFFSSLMFVLSPRAFNFPGHWPPLSSSASFLPLLNILMSLSRLFFFLCGLLFLFSFSFFFYTPFLLCVLFFIFLISFLFFFFIHSVICSVLYF